MGVWKSTIKCDHYFYGKINIFSVKSTFLLKSWFHEIFWAWSRFSVLFHTVQLQLDLHLIWRKNYPHGTEKKSSNQLFSNLFIANVTFTKFLSKQSESKFPQFSKFSRKNIFPHFQSILTLFARFHIIFGIRSIRSSRPNIRYFSDRKRILKTILYWAI